MLSRRVVDCGVMSSAFPGRVRRAGRWARGWITSAPGTYVWLLILAVTALQFQQLPKAMRHVILHVDSTNLFQLTHHPVHVLVLSALWTQVSSLPTYVVLFNVLHVPAERWLGSARWLAVVALAHVGATLVSEAGVWSAIRFGLDPGRMQYTLDIGVSYGLAGAAGVLTYRFVRPWQQVYLVGAGVYLVGRLALFRTFTDIGHLVGFVIGLACLPLTRSPRGARPARVR